MSDQDKPAQKRHGAGWLLVILLATALLTVWLMYGMGKKALSMDEAALELNRLMRARTLACSEPVDPKVCGQATRELDQFEKNHDMAGARADFGQPSR